MDDEKAEEAEKRLKKMLDDEFLDKLVIAVKTCGNMVDHVESTNFVEWCFELAERDPPDLEPFDYQ